MICSTLNLLVILVQAVPLGKSKVCLEKGSIRGKCSYPSKAARPWNQRIKNQEKKKAEIQLAADTPEAEAERPVLEEAEANLP